MLRTGLTAAILFVAHFVMRIGITASAIFYFDDVHDVPAARQMFAPVVREPMRPPLAREPIAPSIHLLGDGPPADKIGGDQIAAVAFPGNPLILWQGLHRSLSPQLVGGEDRGKPVAMEPAAWREGQSGGGGPPGRATTSDSANFLDQINLRV